MRPETYINIGYGLTAIVAGAFLLTQTWPEVAKAVPAPSQTGGPSAAAVAPCASAPPGDTLNGTPGAAPCYVPGDATRPTAVQAANVTTDANGLWSVTWGRRFNSGQPVVNPLPVNTGQLPMLCNVAARSATSANGRCWQSTATTLPGTLVTIAGLVVSPFGTSANNAAVMVIAREPTQ